MLQLGLLAKLRGLQEQVVFRELCSRDDVIQAAVSIINTEVYASPLGATCGFSHEPCVCVTVCC